MKKLKYLMLLGFLGWISGSFLGSQIAIYPKFANIPEASNYFSQHVDEEIFFTKDNVKITSWFIPNQNSRKAVVLLNGIGANRIGLVERADFYSKKDFNVLLLDLRGTGESGGEAITFGWEERWDLEAGINFLKNKKGIDSIAVHGLSLGAATIAYSFQDNPDYDFVVLESCYDNIENALRNRIDQFYLPYFLMFPMRKFTEWKLNVTEEELSPVSYMSSCKFPILIMAGDSEKKVKKSETEMIFQQCNSVNLPTGVSGKKLHFFKNGKHENFMNRYKEEWKSIMNDWLKTIVERFA